eukprot:UN24418
MFTFNNINSVEDNHHVTVFHQPWTDKLEIVPTKGGITQKELEELKFFHGPILNVDVKNLPTEDVCKSIFDEPKDRVKCEKQDPKFKGKIERADDIIKSRYLWVQKIRPLMLTFYVQKVFRTKICTMHFNEENHLNFQLLNCMKS